MKPVVVGTRYGHTFVPEEGDTASAIGNTGVHVVSTPVLIGYIEQTCHLLVAPAYEADEATVGFRVDVEHLAPGVVGDPVRVTAELVSAEGRALTFDAEVHQGEALLMRGRHERRMIRLDRFAARDGGGKGAPAREPTSAEFWFDFNSPWCYLAASRIGDIARRQGATLVWRPVHIVNLLDRIDGRRVFDENASFVAWYRRDLRDWVELAGLRLEYHPDFPLRPSRALRASLYAQDEGLGEAFVTRVMRAYWAEGADISQVGVLSSLAADAGLDGDAIPAVVADPAYKARLDENVERAAGAGVFGLPTVIWEGRVFFGNDRLGLLERALSRRGENA